MSSAISKEYYSGGGRAATMTGNHELTIVSGSPRIPSRTRALADRARHFCESQDMSVTLLDLGERRLELFDGRDFEDYNRITRETVTDFIEGRCILIASPVYFAGISGSLKNLFDLIPYDRFQGPHRAAGMLMTGRDRRHQLVLDTHLRPTLVYLGFAVASTSVFAVEDDFRDFGLTANHLDEWIETTIAETVALSA